MDIHEIVARNQLMEKTFTESGGPDFQRTPGRGACPPCQSRCWVSGCIRLCFRLGVEQNGVPNEVYFDNGKDYRSSSFSKDYPMSLVNQLGVGTIYATPYHGAAKTVDIISLGDSVV